MPRHVALPEAVQRLSREFDLSERQHIGTGEASSIDRPVDPPTVPINVELPASTVKAAEYAQKQRLTDGSDVTR